MIRIAFTGDISLNDDYLLLAEQGADPFETIEPVLGRNDVVVVNLEAVAAGEGENLKKKPRLKTSMRALEYLESLHVGIVCLAHNHVYDNLESGFTQTTAFLRDRGIAFMGAGTSPQEASRPVMMEIKGKTIAFFNYVDADTRPDIPEEAGLYVNMLDSEQIAKDLKNSTADYRILVLHWGGRFEGGLYPGMHQQEIARKAILAGADLVVGHHSHTLQPSETFHGRRIFYSLGNFCFSDIRHEDGIQQVNLARYQRSAILECTLEEGSIRCDLFPFRNKNLKLLPDQGVRAAIRRRQLMFSLMRHIRVLWFYYYFHYRFIRPVVQVFTRKDKRSMGRRIREFRLRKLVNMFKS